jgi:hypothetical protein
MSPRKKPEPFKLGEERWGEKVRRAYYRGKRISGYTWASLAETISQVAPMSDAGLQRFMRYETKPTGRAVETAYLLCLAMGVDPGELGIDESEIQTPLYTSKTVRDLLFPASRCFAGTAA